MRLQQLKSLVSIVRHGSFTRAATQLFVSQPSLSQQIRQLEDELGVDLLDRSGRRVRLTAAGERLLPRAARILAEVRSIELEAAELRGDAAARLSVAMVPQASERLLPSLFHAFRATCADTLLDVSELSSSGVAEAVRSGDADLGIAAWSPALPGWYEGVDIEGLGLGRLVACVPADSDLAQRQELPMADLENEPVVMFREGYLTRDLVAAVAPFDLREAVVLSTDNSFSARHLVAAGLGIAFLSTLPGDRAENLAWAGTQTIPVVDPIVSLGLCILTGHHAHLSRAAHEFTHLVRQQVSQR